MRLLTLVTLISVPITVIATIFGMYIELPYGHHPLAFYAVNGLAIGFTIVFIWHLRRKHWL